MRQKRYLKTLIFFTIFIIFQSGLRGAEAQELSVEDLLYKGRTELSDDNPTGDIVYFIIALRKCNPGSASYNSRYGRCNFFVGEAYFQRFEAEKNTSDAKTAIEYFDTVIDFGKKTTQDYPSLAKGRIKQINRALSTIETGVSSETDRTFKVKTVSKGKIVANSWNLYVNGERIDTPFVELFFIEDHSGDTPEALRKAVYISDAGAAEVARKLGIQHLTQKGYSYDRYDVLNLSRTFHKSGFPDIVLKNGERFNGQWAIIEYDLGMPALPVKLFEHFGASVQANWSERKVMINAKAGSPITKDWFDLVGELMLPPSGAGGDWIIGFQDFQLPEKIYSGQLVQGRVDLQVKDNARNSANAVLYVSLFGDWSPGIELTRIYKGTVGSPRRVSMPFSFKAPSKPGTYRLRCPMVLAFAPVKNFYGSKPGGQNDPGVGPYTEVSFIVAKPQVNEPTTSQKPPGECTCTRDSSGTWHCTFKLQDNSSKAEPVQVYGFWIRNNLIISHDLTKCFWGTMEQGKQKLGYQFFQMDVVFGGTGFVWIGGLVEPTPDPGQPWRQIGGRTELYYPNSKAEEFALKRIPNYQKHHLQEIRETYLNTPIRDGLRFTRQRGPLEFEFIVVKADIETFRTNPKATDLIINFSIKKR